MNGTNGKQSDFPDVALVPYPVIVAATKGDPDAMKREKHLLSLSMCGIIPKRQAMSRSRSFLPRFL